MGRIPKPETERDLALIKDYLSVLPKENPEDTDVYEYSIAQLGIKYARVEDGEIYPLTATRIHQILNRHKVPKNRSTGGVARSKSA